MVGLLLRLLTLDSAISFDEQVQTSAVIDANFVGLDKYTEMNPLTTWTRLMFTSLLEVQVWNLRLTSLIFAALTVWVLFLLARELYGTKTARWSAALLALSAWHALVSTSISFDGTFLAFYTLLALFCYVRHENTGENRWLVWAGLAFGLAVLTKYTGFLVLPAIALYSLIRFKKFGRTLKECAIIAIVGAAIFSVFPLVAFLFSDPSYFWITLQHGSGYFGGRELSLALLAIQYALAFIWMGPLLLFGYFLSWRKPEARDWLSHSLIFVVLAFYTFVVQDPFRPVERYFTVFLPVLCMLVGKQFAEFSFNSKQWKLFGIMLAGGIALAVFLNIVPGTIMPFYPKTEFISAMFSFNWNFFIPFTGDQGPVGLYVKFLIFALAFLVGATGLVAVFKEKHWGAPLLLAAGLALSLFMMAELAVQPTSPDISGVIKETTDFVKQSGMPGPFYTFRDTGIQYYLRATATNFDFSSDPEEVEQILGKGGTLVVIDFPMLNKNSELWQTFTKCDLKTIKEDKGVPLGYVFAC